MQDGEVLYEIPVRNVSERKGQKKTLPPRSGGRDCKSRPAKIGFMQDGVCNPVPRSAGVTFQSVKDKKKRYPRGAGDGIANPVRLKIGDKSPTTNLALT
jgi:hypothetical protein